MNLQKFAKAVFEAVLIITALLFLVWFFAPKELLKKQISLNLEPGPGREIFRIFSGIERFPKITLAIIEPQDVKPGDIQKLTLQVEDPAGVAEVFAITELDNGTFKLQLELRQGNETLGYWTSAWIVHDTHSKKYRTKFIATNKKSETNSITLAWSDTCTPPLNGDWNIVSGDPPCTAATVTGADNGNIVWGAGATSTLTIPSGATVVYNNGKSITIGTGQIAVSAGGQIVESNLWITDADNDNYAPSGYSKTYAATEPAGFSRQFTTPTTDCCDNKSAVNPGAGWNYTTATTTCATATPNDWNCSGATNYASSTSADLCGCGDGIMTPGYSTNPGCGTVGTYYLSCYASSTCMIYKTEYISYTHDTTNTIQGCR